MLMIYFYGTQYVQSILMLTCKQHKKNEWEILHSLFHTEPSESSVYFTHGTSPWGLAVFQMCNSHMWLVAAILDRAAVGWDHLGSNSSTATN